MAAAKEDPLDVTSFLIYLAEHANPKRFMPFPNWYRKRQITSEDSFDPYTDDEYDLLKSDLVLLKKDPRANPRLLKYITTIEIGIVKHNAQSIHPLITEYEFKYSALEERIRRYKYPNKRWFLFHGSTLGNWHSILRNGIRNMSNTRFMSFGASLGEGVYLANSLAISMMYGESGSHSCVAVVEILADPSKYHKGGGVYVIPDDSILVARYLYQISNKLNKHKCTGTDVLEYYKKLAEQSFMYKDNTARLIDEAKELKDMLIERTLSFWVVLMDNALFRIYVDGFPYQSPIIQPFYKLNGGAELFIYNDWSPMFTIKNVLSQYKKEYFPNSTPVMTDIPIEPLVQI